MSWAGVWARGKLYVSSTQILTAFEIAWSRHINGIQFTTLEQGVRLEMQNQADPIICLCSCGGINLLLPPITQNRCIG